MSRANPNPVRFRRLVTNANWTKGMTVVAVQAFEKPDPRWPAEVVVLDANDPRVAQFLAKHSGK